MWQKKLGIILLFFGACLNSCCFAQAAVDLDENGIVNKQDLVLLKKYLKGDATFNMTQVQRADLNQDGKIDQQDLDLFEGKSRPFNTYTDQNTLNRTFDASAKQDISLPPPRKFEPLVEQKVLSPRLISFQGKWNLIGAASVNGTTLELTPARPNKAGTAWYTIPFVLDQGFTMNFRFKMFKPSGISDGREVGGDGLAFVIQSQGIDALGTPGSGIGYEGIARSLAIELDSWNNQPTHNNGDPDGRHISIQSRGREPNSQDHRYSIGVGKNVGDLSDGQSHLVTIRYVPGKLTVWFDQKFVVAANVDLLSLGVLDRRGEAWVGFTAATGSAWETHEILGLDYLPVLGQ